MKKILVLGGTGFVGRHVCEKLVSAGYRVTVPTRQRPHANAIAMLPTLTVLEANIHDAAVLQGLVHGHDAVVNLVAILQGNEAAFDKAHVQLADKIARACQAGGVRRLVHVSALGADARNPAALPSMYLRSKSRGEQVLQHASLDLTILRPSVIFGAEDKFLNVFAQLQQLLPVIPLAGAHALFQPVWVEDVAKAVLQALHGEFQHSSIGQTYEAVGPDVFKLKQLVQLAGGYAGVNEGRGRPVLALPDAVAQRQKAMTDTIKNQMPYAKKFTELKPKWRAAVIKNTQLSHYGLCSNIYIGLMVDESKGHQVETVVAGIGAFYGEALKTARYNFLSKGYSEESLGDVLKSYSLRGITQADSDNCVGWINNIITESRDGLNNSPQTVANGY